MRRLLLPIATVIALNAVEAVTAQQYLPRSHPKCKTARGVFNDLVRAIGDGRTRPKLQVLPAGAGGRMKVAWYVPQANAVTIEERAYDLCAAMGSDSLSALATLLGHELAHYYKDHGWVGDFGNGFADLEVGQTLAELKHDLAKVVEMETEADYFGGFAGYVAGYNSLGVAPRTFSAVYDAYELSAEIPGYPSLAERQEIAQRSEDKVRNLVPIFEAGTKLMIIGRYEEASRLFDFIARDFPSREILNNAGVARVLEALSLYPAGRRRYVYPLELDAETRLSGTKADEYGFAEDNEERIGLLLEEAQEAFESAIRKDNNYATAHVNLACAYGLQEEFEDAVDSAEKAIRLAEKGGEVTTLANGRIALAIAQAEGELQENRVIAEGLRAALVGNEPVAQKNLSALAGGTAPPNAATEAREIRSAKKEIIAGKRAFEYDDVIDSANVVSEVPRRSREMPAITVYSRHGDGWQGLVIDAQYHVIAIREALPGYGDPTRRGVSIGDSRAKVIEEHGAASRIVTGRQGVYCVYDHARIAFQVSEDNQVQGWFVYAIEE